MMEKRSTLGLLIPLLLLVGCSAPAPEASPKTTPETKATESKGSAPVASLDALPASLKHDAFEYYGLGATTPMKVRYSATGMTEGQDGTMMPKLQSISGGEATFLIERTGALAMQGTEELMLKEDGLYATKVSGSPVNPPQLEMPAKLEVGKSWTTSSDLTLPDSRQAKIMSTSTVKAMEKIKVKAGEFDTVRIEASGTMTLNSAKNQIKMTGWFAKGRGPVKIEVEQTTPDGQKQRATFEAVP